MDHSDAQATLQSLFDATGKAEDEFTSADLLEIALQFFDIPSNGCTRDDGSDALLFQCGVYDWGEETDFEVEIVRQFTVNGFDGEYDHMEQLHATLYYPAELAAGQEVAISIWSQECADMADFRQKVTESAGYKLTESVKAREMKVHQERV